MFKNIEHYFQAQMSLSLFLHRKNMFLLHLVPKGDISLFETLYHTSLNQGKKKNKQKNVLMPSSLKYDAI